MAEQRLEAEFGDGPFIEILKLLNGRQRLLVAKLHIGVKMKYLFGLLTGNIHFYKEEVADSHSFSKRLW